MQDLPADPQPVHHAGAVALHQHGRGFDEAQERLVASVGLQVQDDAPLAAVDRVEEDALPIHQRRRQAHVVAGAWLLDLDDVGAQVGQQLGAVGARQKPRQVQDPDPGQGHLDLIFSALLRW